MSTLTVRKLGELHKGEKGLIIKVGSGYDVGIVMGEVPEPPPPRDEDLSDEDRLVNKLLEMGLLEGAEVAVVHEAPFGGDPIAVRVRGGIVALRRDEANLIEVQMDD